MVGGRFVQGYRSPASQRVDGEGEMKNESVKKGFADLIGKEKNVYIYKVYKRAQPEINCCVTNEKNHIHGFSVLAPK